MNIEAVIFDMDGTITDTEKYYNQTWPQAFAACGYPDFTREDALVHRSLNYKDAQTLWAARYGSDFSFTSVREVNNKLVTELMEREGIQPKPGVSELLAYLRQHRIPTAVATATQLERAMNRLASVGLADAFDHVISATMVPRGKPYPDVYLHACQELNADPRHCVAIEDAPHGIRSAHDAGCITIMVPDLTMPTPDITPLLHGWASDLSQVIPILESL